MARHGADVVGSALEYVTLVLLALVQVVLNLASPFALEQFLGYGSTRK